MGKTVPPNGRARFPVTYLDLLHIYSSDPFPAHVVHLRSGIHLTAGNLSVLISPDTKQAEIHAQGGENTSALSFFSLMAVFKESLLLLCLIQQ